MPAIIVTGATGFVGRHCVAALKTSGWTVHGVSRHAGSTAGVPADHWSIGDLLEPAFRRALFEPKTPTALLHCAWITDHGDYWTHPDNARWQAASIDLFAAAARSGVRRLVGVGSCAEYNWSALPADCGPLHEYRGPLVPDTPYGNAKLEVARWMDSFSGQEGCSTAWGRIFFPIGAHENPKRLVPSICKAVLSGEAVAIGPGDLCRDVMDVRDVARGFVRLLESDVTGAINIASGLPTTLAELAERISRLVDPAGTVQIGARPRRDLDPQRLIADVGRLNREVGFAPAIDLNASLANALQWWADQR